MATIIGFILMSTVTGYLIWTNYSIYISAFSLIREGTLVEGKVIEIETSQRSNKSEVYDTYRAKVQFNYSGQLITAKEQEYVSEKIFKVGQEVSVYCNANDFSKIWIKEQSLERILNRLYLYFGFYSFYVWLTFFL